MATIIITLVADNGNARSVEYRLRDRTSSVDPQAIFEQLKSIAWRASPYEIQPEEGGEA